MATIDPIRITTSKVSAELVQIVDRLQFLGDSLEV